MIFQRKIFDAVNRFAIFVGEKFFAAVNEKRFVGQDDVGEPRWASDRLQLVDVDARNFEQTTEIFQSVKYPPPLLHGM